MTPLQPGQVAKINLAARAGGNFSALSFVVASVGLAVAPPARAQEWPTIALTEVAVGFSGPVHLAHAGDGSGRLFVVELSGRIYALRSDGTRTLFLDIQGRIGSQYQGLLSMAFPPGFQTATNKHFYVNYTDLNSDLVISRFFVSADSNGALPDSEQVIIKIPKVAAYGVGPAIFHSGGELAFGPDGFLYFGVGDGDTGKSPGDSQKVAQSLSSLRGKVLRLDVESVGGPGYVVPSTNPFVTQSGTRSEVWAVGVRNPWRSAFDRANGDFYLGDVGQDKFEEINFQAAGTAGGHNYGWSVMEGPEMYNGTSPPPNYTPPIATYIIERTAGDCSITAGRVYRGPGNPRMQGVYFYGDFCSGKIWGLRKQNDNWITQLVRGSPPASGPALSRDGLVSFGEDEIGNLYLTDRIAGKIYRLSDSSSGVNNAPTASNHSASGPEDQQVNVALVATDADGDALTFVLVSAPTHGTLSGTAPNLVYTPVANYSGTDGFTFRVTDGVLQSNVATVSLTLSPVNDAPSAGNMTVTCLEDASANIALSGSDVDNDPLTYAVITGPVHGALTGSAPNLTYTPVPNYAGPDTFTFRASDAALSSSAATVSITVNGVNDAPIATPLSVSVPEDNSLSVPLPAADIDGGTLTFTTTSPAHGTLTGTGANRVYRPVLNYVGTDTFSFTASDGTLSSNSAAVSLTITPVNDAPVAAKDSATTKKGIPVVVPVLANDTDVDGDSLTITGVGNPSKGTAVAASPGIRYTPDPSTVGNVNFTYTISDGKGGSATGTVTVTISKK